MQKTNKHFLPLSPYYHWQDFPTETWGADQLAGAAEEGLWADDWEDEDVDADFDKVLREELDKSAAAAAASIPSKWKIIWNIIKCSKEKFLMNANAAKYLLSLRFHVLHKVR